MNPTKNPPLPTNARSATVWLKRHGVTMALPDGLDGYAVLRHPHWSDDFESVRDVCRQIRWWDEVKREFNEAFPWEA